MRHLSHIQISALSLLVLAGACDQGPEDAGDRVASRELEIELEDGEEAFGDAVTVLDEVELAGGTKLSFFTVELEGEQTLGLLEHQPAGALGIAQVPRLAGASPLDIYLAITGPEVEVPLALLTDEDQQLGERGWLVAAMAASELELGLTSEGRPSASGTACDAGFEDFILDWVPPYGGQIGTVADDRKWDLGSDPGVDADWWGPTEPLLGIACPGCSESWYHRRYFDDQWEIANHDETKVAFAACTIGTRPTISAGGTSITHLGPKVYFELRADDNETIDVLWIKDLAEADEGGKWRLYWRGSVSVNDVDVKLEVQHARATDLFDFAWFWNDNGW